MLFDFLIDSHCHLKYLKDEYNFSDDFIINDALNNNIKILNNICTNINEFEELLELSNKYDNIYCTIGQHPENVNNQPPTLDFLIEKAKNNKVIGIGECGLDYHYSTDLKVLQKKIFEIHIEASRKTNLPLIIHSRDCDKDMIELLESEYKNGAFRFILHCFSSSVELAFKGLDLGGYISLSGIITFKNAIELQNIVKKIPLSRMLIETDAPFLAPIPMRGKTNFPSYIKYTAEFLSKLLNVQYINFVQVLGQNFFDIFDRVVFE